MTMEIGSTLPLQSYSFQGSVSEKNTANTPVIVPALDPVDISTFNVTNRNTDAGKIDKDPKSKMTMKDYIAYMLMLIEKLHKYKEDGPGPVRAKMEYQDELNTVLKKLSSD